MILDLCPLARELAEVHAKAFDDAWSEAEIAAILASPGVVAFGARRDADLAALLLCRIAADEAEVLTLATVPEYRRRGYAACLIEAGAETARSSGAKALFLEAAADNAAALGLYAQAGFATAGRRPGYYKRSGGTVDALILRLDLNSAAAPPYATSLPHRSVAVDRLEKLCIDKGMRMTEQRRVIARVLSLAADHPHVEELHRRAHAIDPHISIATVYRTVRLFEESGILTRHDFRDGRSRYEEASDSHHDHLIDMKSGAVVEFVDDEIEALQKAIAKRLGYRLIDHRLELYGVPADD